MGQQFSPQESALKQRFRGLPYQQGVCARFIVVLEPALFSNDISEYRVNLGSFVTDYFCYRSGMNILDFHGFKMP